MVSESELDGDLPFNIELKAFFIDSDNNVDGAILHYIKVQEVKHPVFGVNQAILENYFVHKSMILDIRRFWNRLKSLLAFNLIEKSVVDGYVYYKLKKDVSQEKTEEKILEQDKKVELEEVIDMSLVKGENVYCMKCKTSVVADLQVEEKITTRGVKYMYVGVCPTCGTKVVKMGKKV